MKKNIALLLFSVFIFIQCNKDDENDALYGTWIGISISVECASDPTKNSSSNLSCSETDCRSLELLSDGTFKFQRGSGIEEGTWATSGGIISLCQDDDGVQVCEEFAIEENTSTTLVLSITNEANGCKTSTFYQSEASLITADTNTP